MSSSRSRSEGSSIENDVEPVEQVLAEPAGGDGLGEVHVGGGDDPAIGLDRLVAADALEPAVLEHAQQLGLHPHRHVADLVEKQRPLAGQLEPPLLLAVGPGERPALVAEQLGLEQVLGQGRAVDGHQGPAPGHVAEVDRLGHQLLAGAGFAGHQHVARRRRYPRHAVEDVHHPGAPPQQVVIGVLPPQPAPQVGDLVDQPAVLQRLVDHDLQPDRVDRLEDHVIGAQLHRLDGGLYRRIAGHHDDRHGQLALADRPDQVQAVHPRQPQVGQDQRAAVLHQPFHRRRAVRGHLDLPVGCGQQLRELLADKLAVVHHEDASVHGALIRG